MLEARDGIEGIKQVHSLGGRVDLIVSDVVMPGLGGRELAAEIARAYPSMRVLLISGYPGANEVEAGDEPAKATDFVQKPLAPAELARKVREMLDAKK